MLSFSWHHIVMKYAQLAFVEGALCRCLVDARAVQSRHSHISGRKQPWYKIHRAEQHPPLPWLMVCEHSLTKSPQHTLLAGAQTCYQKCWGAPARRQTTRWWGEENEG